MTDEQIKEAFETWLRNLWGEHRTDPYLRDCNDIDPESTYQDQDTELAWIAFQIGYYTGISHE